MNAKQNTMAEETSAPAMNGLKWTQDKANTARSKGKYVYVNADKQATGMRAGSAKAMEDNFKKDTGLVYIPDYDITGFDEDVAEALWVEGILTEGNNPAEVGARAALASLGVLVIDSSNYTSAQADAFAQDYEARARSAKVDKARQDEFAWNLEDIVTVYDNIGKLVVVKTEGKSKAKGGKKGGKTGRRANLAERYNKIAQQPTKALKIQDFSKGKSAVSQTIPTSNKTQFKVLDNNVLVKDKADLDAFILKYLEDGGDQATVDVLLSQFGTARRGASPGRARSSGRVPAAAARSTGRAVASRRTSPARSVASRTSPSRQQARGRVSPSRQQTQRVSPSRQQTQRVSPSRQQGSAGRRVAGGASAGRRSAGRTAGAAAQRGGTRVPGRQQRTGSGSGGLPQI